MALLTAEDVYEQVVKGLPAAERLRLVEKIARDLSVQPTAGAPPARRHWSEIRGIVAYPMCGGDAQEWVSRGRREADEEREKQWGPHP
ncbi:MAG TPA: hypothetical protein VKA46_05325 [Gemmataceae bacterium]|nr:hypothetical protein [Gemmataceae bacterium]